MFGWKHYIPILRWKAAEKVALQRLKAEYKPFITPLIEFTMPEPKLQKVKRTPIELLQESINIFMNIATDIPSQILKYWGCDTIFIDFQLIDSSIRAQALDITLTLGYQMNIFIVPVITIIPVVGFESDKKTRQVAIKFATKTNNGLCFRITESNFSETSFSKDVESFINTNSLDPKNIDLLVDFKVIGNETKSELLSNKIAAIPYLKKWRTFTIAGGAFPKDLSQFKKYNQYNVPRMDWITWQQLIKSLERAPSFADYAIQYPIYMPPISGSNPSASIRYTVEEYWLVLRGEGLRNPKGHGFNQYPAQAKLLFDQKVFKGADFSFGDEYIAQKAANMNTKSPGNPKTWLEAGLNHHMTLVAYQLACIPGQ